MDTAPDQGNPPQTLTALEKEVLKHIGYAVVFGVICCAFLLLALSAWNAIFMASAVGWWGAASAAAGACALNELIKASRKVALFNHAQRNQATPKDCPEGHPHAS